MSPRLKLCHFQVKWHKINHFNIPRVYAYHVSSNLNEKFWLNSVHKFCDQRMLRKNMSPNVPRRGHNELSNCHTNMGQYGVKWVKWWIFCPHWRAAPSWLAALEISWSCDDSYIAGQPIILLTSCGTYRIHSNARTDAHPLHCQAPGREKLVKLMSFVLIFAIFLFCDDDFEVWFWAHHLQGLLTLSALLLEWKQYWWGWKYTKSRQFLKHDW